MNVLALLSVGSLVVSQRTVGGPTQPGLPDGCIGSFPNIPDCEKYNWYLPYDDPCAPPGPYPISGQQVYIKDATNFCLNLPNPDSIFLQNVFYNVSKLPTIVQAEGFVRSYCMGDYLPPGSLKLPAGGIRSANVVKYANYIQIHGKMDCGRLNINCTMSAPGAFDDGGQYDNGGFRTCGKEPYSGVDRSAKGNPEMGEYVEMAGNGLFCMRVCLPGTMVGGGVCDVTKDTAGCMAFMGVKFTDADGVFSYQDTVAGTSTSVTLTLPPLSTSTSKTTTATAAATTSSAADAVKTSEPSGSTTTTSSVKTIKASSANGPTTLSTTLLGIVFLVLEAFLF
ncbi:hypothetical protein BDR26DRAFT_856983 [Obelidium mucronatum]|nr:hypothetical protein BDR26DRAFT_856983 [Obelidium mucronatum]